MIGKIGTNQLQEAIINLFDDPVRNSSIIGFIKNNPISSLLSEGNSLLVQGTSDREWIYISSNDKEEVQRLLLKLESDDCCFASLEDWMIPEVTRDKDVEWQLTTIRYFLPDEMEIHNNKINIASLNTVDAEYIIENSDYKQFLTVEYLKQRIKESFTAAIKEKNKLIAWALTHDDGAIGALYVLDRFRNSGYASEIIRNLSYKIRETGSIPIAQIEEKNIPAAKLFEKLGFIKDRRVIWLKLFHR
jgi:8-oxo-dGTP diphosphatase